MSDNKKIDTKKIKKIAEELLQKIAPEVQVNVLPVKDATVSIEAKVDDPQLLIGSNSETLLAVQHLLKAMLRRIAGLEAGELLYVDLDVNNYKKKRKEYLRELAVSTANEAALAKKEKILAAMSAYERRIVHMALAERTDITTESRGQEPDRRIVIKPSR